MRNIGNKIGYVVAVAAAMVTCGGFAALEDMGEPVWKLEKPVALSETSSIKVPCTAIPDTTAFTVEAKFDYIVFNNGLHSLHWTEDKVTDAQIEDITRGMVNALRKGCSGARLIWLSTTPHTERSPGSGLGDRNPIVLRINRIAEKVMKDEKIDIIDGYGLLKDHLDWTRGDGYHWNDNAYKLIAETIIGRTIGKP